MSKGGLGAKSLRTAELKNKNMDRKDKKQISDSDFRQRREGIAGTGKENKRKMQLYQLYFSSSLKIEQQ